MEIQGIGIDIVDIERIEKMIKRYGNRFLKRIFTEREIDYAIKNKNSAEHFAGRFAAKEAVIKASREALPMKEIEILNKENGEPFVEKMKNILISISHEKKYAVAVAIVRSQK